MDEKEKFVEECITLKRKLEQIISLESPRVTVSVLSNIIAIFIHMQEKPDLALKQVIMGIEELLNMLKKNK